MCLEKLAGAFGAGQFLGGQKVFENGGATYFVSLPRGTKQFPLFWRKLGRLSQLGVRIPEFMLGMLVPYLTHREDMLETGLQRFIAHGAVMW